MIGSYLNDEKEDEDGQVCHICLDGSNYEGNDIIFCDKCDVAVHQSCYGVPIIPEGPWYCYVCEAGGDPSTTICALCINTGGAYKRTNVPNVWAHGICSTWIPEIFSTDHTGRVLNISYLDKKREKLKCSLCTSKGYCIQCAYGRCATAVHPWCCLFKKQGFTNRIVKDKNDQTVWEVFCRTHAAAVSEPVKPKVKAKSQQILMIDDDNAASIESFRDESIIDNLTLNDKKNRRIIDDDTDDENGFNVKDNLKRGKGKGPTNISQNINNSSLSKLSTGKYQNNFQMWTLSEWPGQLEGEGLDLDHFWNFISMAYPEDQSTEWLEYVMESIQSSMTRIFDHDPFQEYSSNSDDKDIILSDKDRSHVTDIDRRNQFLSFVYQDINKLSENVTKEKEYIPGTKVVYLDENLENINEEMLYLTSETKADTIEINDPDRASIAKIAIDGDKDRYDCNFTVERKESLSDQTCMITDEQYESWKNEHIIGIDNSTDKPSLKGLSSDLISFNTIPKQMEIPLGDGTIVKSKDEDNIILRMLRSDQLAYQRLSKTLRQTYESLLSSSKLEQLSNKNIIQRENDTIIESIYQKQRIWRRIARGFYLGVRDQGENFNHVELDSIPASWRIKVDGRPIPNPNDVDDEIAEDAICMCCFDGTSSDGNRIIFCDGCNATVHQSCYGIIEIPEGDFYCDRCKEVQYSARNQGRHLSKFDIGRLVTCALCPIQHGGLKSTTDGRWVHVCCAIWSKSSNINELNDMSPIDISEVEIQRYHPHRSDKQSNTLSETPCCICKVLGGYVVRCSGMENNNDSNSSCQLVFHPLCAWFEGLYCSTTIMDPTFQGKDRNGLFPSGLSFHFYCYKHCNNHQDIQTTIQLRQKQMQLRRKYMMKLEDLECIPGSSKKQRYRPKQKKDNSSSSSTNGNNINSSRGTHQSQEKELTIDIYDNKTCACCLGPIDLLRKSITWKKFYDMDVSMKFLSVEENSITKPSDEDEENVMKEFIENDKRLSQSIETSETMIKDHEDFRKLTKSDQTSDERTAIAALLLSANSSSVNMNPDPTENQSNDINPNIPSTETSVYRCESCGISIHADCLQDLTNYPIQQNSIEKWACFTCRQEKLDEAICLLCPRRGGFFLNTLDGNWGHVFCAKNTSCHIKIIKSGEEESNPGTIRNAMIDIISIPKDKKAKQKCIICNRRVGICESCNYPGCGSYFHPICAERSGKGYIHVRNGYSEYYCSNHLPDGIERITYRTINENGIAIQSRHWINSMEMQRLRYVLVRSLTIFDSITRREKLKRLLNKADNEYYTLRMNKLLDKCKGRKTDGFGGIDVGELFQDTSSDEDNEELIEDVDYMSDPGENQKIENTLQVSQRSSGRPGRRKKQVFKDIEIVEVNDWIPFESSPGEYLSIPSQSNDGESLSISPSWHNGSSIRLPNRLFLHIAGYEFDRRETMIEGGSKAFLRIFKERLSQTAELTRQACGIFETSQQALEFNRKLSSYITKQVQMPFNEFKSAMAKEGIHYDSLSSSSIEITKDQLIKPMKVKRGYVLINSDDEDNINNQRKPLLEQDLELSTTRRSMKGNIHEQSSNKRQRRSKPNDDDDDDDDDIIGNDEEFAKKIYQDDINEVTNHKRKRSNEEENDKQSSYSSRNRIKQRDPTPKKDKDNIDYYSLSSDSIHPTRLTKQIASTWAGPFTSQHQLEHLLRNDPLTNTLITNISNHSDTITNKQSSINMMEDIYEISGFNSYQDSLNKIEYNDNTNNPNDWKVYDSITLPQLERRIQEILRSLEDHQIPDQANNSKKSIKMRHVCDDFQEISNDLFPEYYQFVRHVITLDVLKDKLKKHMFTSMAMVSKDFYTLLNNARAVTPINSSTWKDSEIMATLYEELKSRSLNESIPKQDEFTLTFTRLDQDDNDDEMLVCLICSNKYMSRTWPKSFIPSLETKSTKKSKSNSICWRWICPNCIAIYKNVLVGADLKVWWHADSKAYNGYLDAIDPVTNKHRVHYEDNEWEFILISEEPVLFEKDSLDKEILALIN